MADRITAAQRSENMRRIRGKHTGPELRVRSMTYSLGFRYRLHPTDLSGRPDLVFRGRRKVIFVHGCFWHAHDDPRCPEFGRHVKSNIDYKLARNRARDDRDRLVLEEQGWKVLTIWDCETKEPNRLAKRLKKFLTGRTISPRGKRMHDTRTAL